MTDKPEININENSTTEASPVGRLVIPCFWISWFQPTEDYRPFTYPPNEKIIGWWCTGQRSGDYASTLVAMVMAESEDEAKKAIIKDWPEVEEWRFCEQMTDKTLSDRFPLSEWMQLRFKEV